MKMHGPAGRAHCAWGGHFVTFYLVVVRDVSAILPLVGMESNLRPTGAPSEAQYKSRSDRWPAQGARPAGQSTGRCMVQRGGMPLQ